MKITVDRTNNPEGDLVFTITVSEPHHSCFGEDEKKMMEILEACKSDVSQVTEEENKVKTDVLLLIHQAKENLFVRVLNNLKFAIENEFRQKYRPICQEIYNWIYDHQTTSLKQWMVEFDPQRTKFYFDNDPQFKNVVVPQASEHEDEDDEEDE